MSNGLLIGLWILFLLLAVPYVARRRDPATPPLAAYLVFVGVFSLCAAALYALLTWLLLASGGAGWLSTPAGAAVFVVLVFVPAILAARAVIGRPPQRGRAPPS